MAEGQSPERNRRGPAVAANEGPKSAKPILAPPSPPLLIPDWRRVESGHPNSSQIGVDFSDQTSIGLESGYFGGLESGYFGASERSTSPLPLPLN
jgi:hypothetical protein